MLTVRDRKKSHMRLDLSGIAMERVTLQEMLPDPPNSIRSFCFRGTEAGTEGAYYLKYTDMAGVDIAHELKILAAIQAAPQAMAPRLVEQEPKDNQWFVTEKRRGAPLSPGLTEEEALACCYELGRTLAGVHQLSGDFPRCVYTRFHSIPRPARTDVYQQTSTALWLDAHKPDRENTCFIHGDFQLQNLLWKDGRITGILDWEMGGMGSREWDIAWAMIQRPKQPIMNSEEQRDKFLEGYASISPYDRDLVCYYMVMIYSWLLEAQDPMYRQACMYRIGLEFLRWQKAHRTVTPIKPILEQNKKYFEERRKAPVKREDRWIW